MKLLVTGGAGFIGSALVRYLIQHTEATVINLDKLTYAGNLESLSPIATSPRHYFEQLDICDQNALQQAFCQYQPDAVMHLAAESHVDRSIDGPAAFIHSNIVGTFNLLEASRHYISSNPKSDFRFLHVSTDEVFGSLGATGYFSEHSPYDPRSPYSASKAASDHLVRAYFHTYGLPVIITNCSNNYGPYQFPEKLIPLVIQKALAAESIPVYGKGDNIRDWLYVDDHVRALYTVLLRGTLGETYTIGGHNEKQNLGVVSTICTLLNELSPHPGIPDYRQLITFVTDRPGHDARYAIDASKIQLELGWQPEESFESGLRKTVRWYLDHQAWSERVLDGSYRLERIGTSGQVS